MYSITMNLMSPRDWRDKLSAFVERLEREFDGRLRLVIALPTPDDRLYESNVLIVLDEVRKEDSIVVASAAPEDVSPLLVPQEDRDAIEAFINYRREEVGDWRDKLSAFVERLEREFDGRLRLVIALPTPDDRLYESNVLIVLDEVRKEDSIVVASAAPEDVSPLLVPQEDRDAIEAFKLLGGRVVFEEEVG